MVVGLWQWILVCFVVDCGSMVVWLDFVWFRGSWVAGFRRHASPLWVDCGRGLMGFVFYFVFDGWIVVVVWVARFCF